MSSQKRWIIPLILVLLLSSYGVYSWLRQRSLGGNGALKASGTVETVEVNIAAELAGKVSEVLVEEGQTVSAGEPLFRLDDAILSSQHKRAIAALEASRAGLKVAESGLPAAQANLALAQANLELAQTQYRIAIEASRKSDERARERSWRESVPYQFNLPVWYFEKNEQIAALEKEVEAAQKAVEDARAAYRNLLEQGEYTQLLQAEDRLALARAAFEIADETLDRAEAANDEDEDEEGDRTTNENDNDEHADQTTFEKAEQALEDAAQEVYDQAKAELEAAQKDYLDLLKEIKLSDEIIQARARWMVAIELYELAQDRLVAQYRGGDSLQILAAQSTVKQAEAALEQAQTGVSQAEAKLEQAQAAVAQAQAEVELLETQIAKLTVYAPMDGVILSRAVEVGEVLQAGATAIVLGNLDELTVTVYIPEDQYGRVQLGMTAVVTADSFPGESFEAVVQRISDQAEFTPRNVQTEEGRRTTVFAIQLRLSDPQGKLKPGMPVDVRFVW
ncbi:MAG: efflux RND transporter periplasmic adaptor subunit [Anaerolineales bacterium]|nr:efflux RND transporter periplasmic adaptor subunit [Anaerolineales bacterium]